MTENTDPNGHMTDEDLEVIKEAYEEDLDYAEGRLGDYPAPKWWIAEPYYGDVD